MAIEKVINIITNTADSIKNVDKLKESLKSTEKEQGNLNESAEEMSDAYGKASKESVKDLDKVGDSAKKQSRVVSGLKTAVSGVGTALKALGIGLIIGLVAKFTQVLSENQKVVDFLTNVSNTFGIILSKIVVTFQEAFTRVSDLTGGFDALVKVVSGSLRIAFNSLKLTVLALQIGFKELKLAYENVFGDDEGVVKATKDLIELRNKVTDTIKDTADAGKQVYNNIGEAVSEVVTGVTEIAKTGVKAITEIDVKSSYAQAKAITEAKKNFELLALQQQRLQLQYQFQAEALRQIRDDDKLSVNERLKANEKIAEVLRKQSEAESATISARIAGLQQEQNLLGVSQERTNEIYQLQTDLIDVAERLKGAESEQLTNKNALLKEQEDLLNTIYENESERELARLEFEAELQATEDAKITKLQERLELENTLLYEDLENKRLIYAEGTQARVDAEQDYLNRKQELDQQAITLENQKADYLKNKDEEELKRKEALEQTKLNLTKGTLNNISTALGQNSKEGKAFAAASALVNTYQGITAELATKTVTPFEFGLKLANIATTAAIGFKSVKDILKTNPKGVSSPSSGNVSGGASAPQAPSFNLVSGSGTNQIAESIAGDRQPLRAYVVSGDVTSQQSLDRTIEGNASI